MKLGNILLIAVLLLIIAYLYVQKNGKEENSEKTVQTERTSSFAKSEKVYAPNSSGDFTAKDGNIVLHPVQQGAVSDKRKYDADADRKTVAEEPERTENVERKGQETSASSRMDKSEKEKQEKLAAVMEEKEDYEEYMAILKKTKWPKTDVTSENFESLITCVPGNDAKLKKLASTYVFLVAVKEKHKDLAVFAMKQLDEKTWQDLLLKISYPCRYCQDTGMRPCRKCHGKWQCKYCSGMGKVKGTEYVKVGERVIYTKYGKYVTRGSNQHYRTVPRYESVEVMVDCKYCKGIGHCKFCEKGKVKCDEPHNRFASINQDAILEKISSSRKELYSCVAKKLKSFDDVVPPDDGDDDGKAGE